MEKTEYTIKQHIQDIKDTIIFDTKNTLYMDYIKAGYIILEENVKLIFKDKQDLTIIINFNFKTISIIINYVSIFTNECQTEHFEFSLIDKPEFLFEKINDLIGETVAQHLFKESLKNIE